MKKLKPIVALAMSLFMLAPSSLLASSHREAPITALDRSADVTDWYAFVSYDNPNKVTFILNVDPLLEPANGPNYFPFDPSVLYEMLVDNNQDGIPDVVFQFRFNTEIRDPQLFTGFVGGIAGIPPITSLSGAGSEGLSLRQTYTVTMVKNGRSTCLNRGRTLYAVPSNVGPLTMPDYLHYNIYRRPGKNLAFHERNSGENLEPKGAPVDHPVGSPESRQNDSIDSLRQRQRGPLLLRNPGLGSRRAAGLLPPGGRFTRRRLPAASPLP